MNKNLDFLCSRPFTGPVRPAFRSPDWEPLIILSLRSNYQGNVLKMFWTFFDTQVVKFWTKMSHKKLFTKDVHTKLIGYNRYNIFIYSRR